MATEVSEKMLDDKVTNAKKISIKTTRTVNNESFSRFFPEELNYRGHISEMEFSKPIRNPRGELSNKLILKTVWFNESFGSNPYWMQILDNEKGYTISCSNVFNQLRGDFYDYSESRLSGWQEEAYNRHKKVLDLIEELYDFSKEEVLIPSLLSM